MDLTVSGGAVIVAHARLDLARDCVRSVRAWLDPGDIVVVLNVPGAVDRASVEQLSTEAKVVSPPAPQGYSANVNLGVRELGDGRELLLLANDDVIFEGESLSQLIHCIQSSVRTGAVGAQLTHPDGREAASFSRFPTVRDLVEASTALPGPLWRRREAGRRQWEAKPGDRGFPVGAVLLVRAAAFADVGGFDEDFFLNWEEADFAFRLLEHGWNVTSCRSATVKHLQGSSIDRDLNFTTFYEGLRVYFRKRLGPTRWRLLALVLALVFAAGAAYDGAVAVLRPRSARSRLRAVRSRWRTRVFFRRRSRRRPG